MRCTDDRSVRTLILRGKGGTFCAGADLKGFKSGAQGGEPNEDEVARGNRNFGDLMLKLNEQPQVVIMLVDGAAIGGGLGLCCVGDVTIVTRDAKFRLSETSLGIPPAQIAPFVTERVGLTHARRLMLTGARFNGAEAVQYGIGHLLRAGRRRHGNPMRRCAGTDRAVRTRCQRGDEEHRIRGDTPAAPAGARFCIAGIRLLHAQ